MKTPTIAEERQLQDVERKIHELKGFAATLLGACSHAFAIGRSIKPISKCLEEVYADVDLLLTQKAVNEAALKAKKESEMRYS
jgi:hypothetical protein